jgi:hypothetical protein
MHAQCKKTQERMGPTPLLPTPAKDIIPEGAPISDNDSVTGFFCLQLTFRTRGRI